MKPREAEDILALLKGAFPAHRLDPTDRDVWIESFSPLDADLAFQAVMRGRNEWTMFPSWARFKEAYRLQQRLREPVGEQRSEIPRAMPGVEYRLAEWIRRWAAARYLYTRFGKEQDMRPFREQAEYVDPLTKEWMPDDAWVEEGARITDEDVWTNVR